MIEARYLLCSEPIYRLHAFFYNSPGAQPGSGAGTMILWNEWEASQCSTFEREVFSILSLRERSEAVDSRTLMQTGIGNSIAVLEGK